MFIKNLPKRKYFPTPYILIIILLTVATAYSIVGFSFSDDSNVITGKVFMDSNGNAKADDAEPGLADVLITDGITIIRTDKNGQFELQTENARHIWISLPPGLEASKSYFYPLDAQRASYDFPVVKASYKPDLEKTIIFMSDLHLRDIPAIKEKMRIVIDRINRIKPDAIFVLGDLVHMAYVDEQAEKKFVLMKSYQESFPAPTYCAVGNNDVFAWEIPELRESKHPLYGKKMFEKYFGPRYYSINQAGFHIIVIDDIQAKSRDDIDECIGWIDDAQLQWLQEDLKHVSPDTPIVIISHIPLVSSVHSFFVIANPNIIDNLAHFKGRIASGLYVANFNQLTTMLKPFKKITFLAGHMHLYEKGSFRGTDRIVNYFICGAVSGRYWQNNIKRLPPLTTTFAPGFVVATCKDGDFIKVRYETFDFFK